MVLPRQQLQQLCRGVSCLAVVQRCSGAQQLAVAWALLLLLLLLLLLS
jgi:hypothetical protein